MPSHKLAKSADIELQLKQSRESLDFALQSGRMGTWDINLETQSISCSQEMLDLWGVSLEEFQGQRSILQSKVHPEDLHKMNEAISEAIRTNTIYELEYRILPSPNVERWVVSRGRCTFNNDSKLPSRFAGVVYDITERKNREEDLARAVKARDHFFMVASHELKTPLTCLQLQLQVMDWELKHSESNSQEIRKIQRGLKKQQDHLSRINRIVNNILDVSKISDQKLIMQYEHFDLKEMVKEVIHEFKINTQTSGIEIQLETLQSVTGKWDRARIEQVLLNLLLNAIRFGENKPVIVEVLKSGEKALMVVRDQGLGIDSVEQNDIFNSNVKVSSEIDTSGMGLGLYISNNIVKAHGGEIKLQSHMGKGSEFTVVLPTM